MDDKPPREEANIRLGHAHPANRLQSIGGSLMDSLLRPIIFAIGGACLIVMTLQGAMIGFISRPQQIPYDAVSTLEFYATIAGACLGLAGWRRLTLSRRKAKKKE